MFWHLYHWHTCEHSGSWASSCFFNPYFSLSKMILLFSDHTILIHLGQPWGHGVNLTPAKPSTHEIPETLFPCEVFPHIPWLKSPIFSNWACKSVEFFNFFWLNHLNQWTPTFSPNLTNGHWLGSLTLLEWTRGRDHLVLRCRPTYGTLWRGNFGCLWRWMTLRTFRSDSYHWITGTYLRFVESQPTLMFFCTHVINHGLKYVFFI